MKSSTETIIGELRILACVIKYERTHASARISEAADHMGELSKQSAQLESTARDYSLMRSQRDEWRTRWSEIVGVQQGCDAMREALNHYARIEESEGFFSSFAHKAIAAAPVVAQPAAAEPIDGEMLVLLMREAGIINERGAMWMLNGDNTPFTLSQLVQVANLAALAGKPAEGK